MKKIVLLLIAVILIVGCSFTKNPKDKVESYLMSYQKKDDTIMAELDENVKTMNYTESQEKKYKEILEKQYKDLKYEIKEEVIDGDNATVTAEITVYDLYKPQQTANSYLAMNKEKFEDDKGAYSEEKFIDYKLDEMKKATETVTYTLSFTLAKTNNEWKINNLDNSTLEKIHGIYNYENR